LQDYIEKIESSKTLKELEDLRIEIFGKKGVLAGEFAKMKSVPNEEKKEFAKNLNIQKAKLTNLFDSKKTALIELESIALMKENAIDVTLFNGSNEAGSLHPINEVMNKMIDYFVSLNFSIEEGPLVEDDFHNFEALNLPDYHPARDMQDTFWIKTGDNDSHKNTVLRTQTSDVQIRSMLKYGAPARLIAPGRVFRNEELDTTHDATFYQVEGLLIDKNINISHLKGVLETMLAKLFKKEIKIRIRPGYFPFVEPGLEVDIWFEIPGKEGKWLEFMGAGMVHPNVLKNCNIDPNVYQGFAFGFGLTRLVMMKYEIEDIRLLALPKKDFLSQF
jgi:phenylalanyl-tRNA synthetase alpha chain